VALCAAGAQCADATKVSKDEAANWICYTVPLPKFILISEKVTVAKGSVAVVPPATTDMVSDQALKELTELVGPTKGQPAFTVTMQLGGSGSESLEKIRNSGQAYLISPVGTDGLKLIALKPAGLYYASKTLQQLIAAKATADKIEMPLPMIVDWPDLEDRGLWGSDNFAEVTWLADRKMNWMEQISASAVDEKGIPYARIKTLREPLVNDAPQRAIKFVPVVLHLEQSSASAITAFPYIKGKSEHGGVMCYSQPKTIEIISSWIGQLAIVPNVTEVDVWMAENLGQRIGCQCNRCKAEKVNPMVLEARAIVTARAMAEQTLGKKIGLRILSSEATEDYNTIILSELPKDVKFVYYHSLISYTCDKRPMMPKYLVDAAKSGRWVATCPNVSAIVGYAEPFESAQFIRYRASELVNNGASGILGYATPRIHFCRYNVEATAEYTWNVNGRSTREFAYSWAVRNGVKDPDKFADFRELIGRVEWDYCGSDWPMRATHKRLVPRLELMLKQGKLPPFGYYIDGFVKAPFGQFPSAEWLKHDLESANESVKLAQEMGVEQFIQEARYAQGLMSALNALYELKGLIKNEKIAPADKAEATRYFQVYVDGFRQAIDALPKWQATMLVADEKISDLGKPAVECGLLVKRMIEMAGEFGIQIN
jgi:hypothetical protein